MAQTALETAYEVALNDILDLEAKLEKSWAGHHVLFVALVAFAVGYIL